LNYQDEFFCDRDDFCRTDSCESLHFEGDHCYEDGCYKGDLVSLKRKNASAWENQVHACVEYLCDNELGPMIEVVCKNTKDKRYVCMNDGCLVMPGGYRVEIDINTQYIDEFKIDTLDEQIEKLTGENNIQVGVQSVDEPYVIRVVVLVEDENSGNTIVKAVNGIDKSEGCTHGTLCRSRNARLISEPLELSGGISKHETTTILILMMTIILALQMVAEKY